MKKFYSAFRSFLGHMGFYFLLTVLVFAFVALGAKSETFNLPLVWVSLLFAALMGLCDFLFAIRFIRSYYIKLFLHVLLSTVSFAIAFAFASDTVERNKTAFFGVLIFALLITVIDTVRGILYAVHAKKENESKKYDYLYSGNQTDKKA